MKINSRDNLILAGDLVLSLLAFGCAYLVVRPIVPLIRQADLELQFAVFGSTFAIFALVFNVSRRAWRYTSVSDLFTIIKAVSATAVAFSLIMFIINRGVTLPRSVPVLTWVFSIFALGGIRIAYRFFYETRVASQFVNGRTSGDFRGAILIGMTDGAEVFLRNLQRSSSSDVKVLGILDDRSVMRGRMVHGVKVVGNISDLSNIRKIWTNPHLRPSEVIVSDIAMYRDQLKRITALCAENHLRVRKLPDIAHTSELNPDTPIEPRDVNIQDLLGRDEVILDNRSMTEFVKDRCVLVTGAGGSIGSEIVRQLSGFGPSKLILVDNSEFLLYSIDNEITAREPLLDIVPYLVDIRDASVVDEIFAKEKPHAVFHAAALKHVPLMEANPLASIHTNVLGTRNVADAAERHAVAAFVMISTDKAVNPTNVMGASKRAAETYCQALDRRSTATRFITVRFGNVLNSNGSVLPLFKKQLKKGGPLTVTHPEITRYFMTIPEAVRLVMKASLYGLSHPAERGRIFVLDMGKPIRIYEMAERLIQLAGFEPHKDIEIKIVGLRPGEKLYEELFDNRETLADIGEDGFFSASPRISEPEFIRKQLVGIERAITERDAAAGLKALRFLVPEYSQQIELQGTDDQSDASSAKLDKDTGKIIS